MSTEFPSRKLDKHEWPALLQEIDDTPFSMRIRGTLPSSSKYLLVVGSRKHSAYGKRVCETLIQGLRGADVCIVSGLAFGVDALAHRAALSVGLPTVAVPGSGIPDAVLYPAAHRSLAHGILQSGGALLSEYDDDFTARRWSFPKRNRIMAGMCHATLIIEATERSGTLITGRLAMEYNRDVLVVPGDIFSDQSKGTNALIRDGAHVVTSPKDIMSLLDLRAPELDQGALPGVEGVILNSIHQGLSHSDIANKTGLTMQQLLIEITKLELKGLL